MLLAALLLTGSLAACTGSEEQESDTAAPVDTNAPETMDGSEDPRLPSGLPETMDLNGYTITFYGRDTDGVYAEEETGDIINDEVFQRNIRLNEQYNFDIREIIPTVISGNSAEIQSVVLAGEDAYQVIIDGPYHFYNYMNSGLLLDLQTMQYQDLSQPWWAWQLNEGLSVNGKYLVACNSFMLESRLWLYNPFVNIDLLEANGMKMADYYQMAREGTWTLDEFIEMIQKGSVDLNGDGIRDHRDRWPLVCEDFAGYALALGCGYRIADKDENDRPVITAATESNINLLDRLVDEIFSDQNIYLCVRNIKDVDSIWTEQQRMMQDDRIIVQIGNMTNDWRSYEINYGILPMPKLTAEQEYYYHTGSCYNMGVMAVPVSVQNPDDVSFILEAMAYDSYYGLLPKFYQKNLETKMARDEDSVEMLRIIHDSMVMDLGASYNWGDYLNKLYSIVNQGKNDMVTHHASHAASVEKKIADFVAELSETR